MDLDYASVWAKLPDDLKDRLRADPTTALTGDDIVALTRAGALIASAYWSDTGPQADHRWMIAWDFRRFIDAEARLV